MTQGVGNLGDFADRDGVLRIWCNRCGRYRERDALTLSLLAGRDRPVYGLFRILRCIECGATGKTQGDVFSMPSWPSVPMGLAHNDPISPW